VVAGPQGRRRQAGLGGRPPVLGAGGRPVASPTVPRQPLLPPETRWPIPRTMLCGGRCLPLRHPPRHHRCRCVQCVRLPCRSGRRPPRWIPPRTSSPEACWRRGQRHRQPIAPPGRAAWLARPLFFGDNRGGGGCSPEATWEGQRPPVVPVITRGFDRTHSSLRMATEGELFAHAEARATALLTTNY
jgi:hypothetical protein